MKKVLVCGGRDFNDKKSMDDVLSAINERHGITMIIHGACRGADTLADAWAKENKIEVAAFKANWGKYGGGAGPIRNQQMLDEGKPDLVVAFPGNKGTGHMIRRSKVAGITVLKVHPK